MQRLTETDLLQAGYPPGPELSAMMVRLSQYEQRGLSDPNYLRKLLTREFGPPPPKQTLRRTPAPLAEAIQAGNAEEQETLHAARRQMQSLLKVPVISRGAILPDACPMGGGEAVIPVGGAIAAEQAILPSAHSADICCSLLATFYEERGGVSTELDALTGVTRFGPGHRPLDLLVDDPVHGEDVWDNPFLTGLRPRAQRHMADQGDGNHFAFLGSMEITPGLLARLRLAGHGDLSARLGSSPAGRYRVLVTHHGSRSLGAHVFQRGQNAARRHTAKQAGGIPDAASWLDARSPEGRAYWEALQYVARWTKANHRSIHRRFLERIGAAAVAEIGNEHNFVWQRGDTFFHGKGATPAWKDAEGRPLLGLIPLNMAEPILLVLGADRSEFLSFAPHGAGRNLSRTALRKRFRAPGQQAEEIARSTAGIDVRWYCGKPDLSETPVAYKNAASVKRQIATFGLAEVLAEIQPLGCIMAGDTASLWKHREEELTPKQLRQLAHRSERRKQRQDLHEDY